MVRGMNLMMSRVHHEDESISWIIVIWVWVGGHNPSWSLIQNHIVMSLSLVRHADWIYGSLNERHHGRQGFRGKPKILKLINNESKGCRRKSRLLVQSSWLPLDPLWSSQIPLPDVPTVGHVCPFGMSHPSFYSPKRTQLQKCYLVIVPDKHAYVTKYILS
jgi:hypothetical protein